MSCLSTARKARIQARITRLEALLVLAYASYEAAITDGNISKYRLDTGGGAGGEQETALRSPAILLDQINQLEASLERLYRKLEGGGVVNMNLRRRR